MLKNKIALVTGGSKGIGYSVAEALLKQNMKVAITGRDINSLERAKDALSKISDNILAIQADASNWEDHQQTLLKIHNHWNEEIEVVVANAGLGHFASIEDLSIDQWKETIDTNLTGVFYTLKSSLQDLIKSKGYIITIASLAGTNFFEKGTAYNASKFGLVGFSQAAMLDLRKYDIKVSTIMPGSVATYFNNHQPNESDAWKIQPEDIAQIVIDLLNMNPRTLPSKIEVRPSRPR